MAEKTTTPTLPLLLCGPILRRVEFIQGICSVSVFVALSQSATLRLEAYPGLQTVRKTLDGKRQGSRATVKLAEKLHVAVVTATWGPVDEKERESLTKPSQAQCYSYNLFVTVSGTEYGIDDDELHTPRSRFKFGYSVGNAEYLPSFSFAPALEKLHILYGSCRKPHGKGTDLLPMVDTFLENTFQSPLDRPHHLLLLGDQIYADDVDPWLIDHMRTLKSSLGFSQEPLPITHKDVAEATGGNSCDTKPIHASDPEVAATKRTPIVQKLASMSGSHSDSHLLFAHEYLLMYLLVWSDVLWPANGSELPKGVLSDFAQGLPAVRRALANVPTLMMFDDHDVTDDWYFDEAVTNGSLSSPLGRHVIRNALTAYALFQHWGNEPTLFEGDKPGSQLLNIVSGGTIDDWHLETSTTHGGYKLNCLLGIHDENRACYGAAGNRIRWHYKWTGLEHQLLFLDTRTWRAWKDPELLSLASGSELISAEGLERQWSDLAPVTACLASFVASATPVFGNRLVENVLQPALVGVAGGLSAVLHGPGTFQYPISGAADLNPQRIPLMLAFAHQAGRAEWDEEAWATSQAAVQRLLKKLTTLHRVIFLSGDVHYAFSFGIDCWDPSQNHCRFIQLCSSAQHNYSAAMSVMAVVSDRVTDPETYIVYDSLSSDKVKSIVTNGVKASREQNILYPLVHQIQHTPAVLRWDAWKNSTLSGLLKSGNKTIPYDRAYSIGLGIDMRGFTERDSTPSVNRDASATGEQTVEPTDMLPFALSPLVPGGTLARNNLGQILMSPQPNATFGVDTGTLIHRLWYGVHWSDKKGSSTSESKVLHVRNMTHSFKLRLPIDGDKPKLS